MPIAPPRIGQRTRLRFSNLCASATFPHAAILRDSKAWSPSSVPNLRPKNVTAVFLPNFSPITFAAQDTLSKSAIWLFRSRELSYANHVRKKSLRLFHDQAIDYRNYLHGPGLLCDWLGS